MCQQSYRSPIVHVQMAKLPGSVGGNGSESFDPILSVQVWAPICSSGVLYVQSLISFSSLLYPKHPSYNQNEKQMLYVRLHVFMHVCLSGQQEAGGDRSVEQIMETISLSLSGLFRAFSV